MMKVLAINGSPRKEWNTAILLKKALDGAASQGAETEMVHLYDLNFKGCTSCFACKQIGGPSFGRCAYRDELAPILEKAASADALILGSPVYFGAASGEMRCFLERLMYPYLNSKDGIAPVSLLPKGIPAGIIYTMNADPGYAKALGYPESLGFIAKFMELIFGSAEVLFVNDTLQYDDYSRYMPPSFDPGSKQARRRDIFPADCRKAFELGVKFAGGSAEVQSTMSIAKSS